MLSSADFVNQDCTGYKMLVWNTLFMDVIVIRTIVLICKKMYAESLEQFTGLVFNLSALFSVPSFCALTSFCRTSKVKNKGPKDIMAVEDMNGEVRFSTHLPYPNNLSR